MAFFSTLRSKSVLPSLRKYYYDDPKNKVNGEFDVVILDKFGYIFYEVIFRKKRISKSMIDEEIEQVRHTGLNCYKYVFRKVWLFSRGNR